MFELQQNKIEERASVRPDSQHHPSRRRNISVQIDPTLLPTLEVPRGQQGVLPELLIQTRSHFLPPAIKTVRSNSVHFISL